MVKPTKTDSDKPVKEKKTKPTTDKKPKEKKQQSPSPVKEKKVKKTKPVDPVAVVSVVGKKKSKKDRVSSKGSMRNQFARLCKAIEVPTLNGDAAALTERATRIFVSGLIRQILLTMKGGKRRTVSINTVKQAFTQYMCARGAPDALVEAALKRADTALEKLQASKQ